MSGRSDEVHAAIRRWEAGGLIDAGTADALRSELRGHAEASTVRLAQYLLAGAGAVVLLIAGGVFIDWAWPILDDRSRTALLAALGVGVLAAGVRMEGHARWRPAALLMQAGAVGLVLSAYVYSERGWAPESPVGVLIGVVALATPIVLTARAMRRDVFMPAVNMAAALVFLAIFLERSTPISGDAVVWTLDLVLTGAILVFVRLLRRDPEGHLHPWALYAFVAAMGGGFVLVTVTAFETLDLSDDAFLAIDAWLALCAATTLWGIHRAPEGLRRGWFEQLLALQLMAWIVFGLLTVSQTFDGPPEAFVLVVSGMGALAFAHGDRHGLPSLMTAATLTFVVPIWWWAVDRGGAFGGVLALLGTAALLFWASGRRRQHQRGDAADAPHPADAPELAAVPEPPGVSEPPGVPGEDARA